MSDCNIMDRVCTNCGQRFGEHYGVEAIHFCNVETFNGYRNNGRIIFSKLFVDSGKRKTRDGMELPTDKDPNILFKRKKRYA